MTAEEKQLLLKELCARQFYGTKVLSPWEKDGPCELSAIDLTSSRQIRVFEDWFKVEEVRPYLRPMSSMTEEEEDEYDSMFSNARRIYCNCVYYDTVQEDDIPDFIDWLLEHHFDYRKTPDGKTMIEAGLAIEAPEDMYKNE